MRIVRDLSELERGRPTVLTIGAFDGIHRGHQYLIRQVVDRARSIDHDSAVITFDPPPQVVLHSGSTQLTDVEEKERIIGAVGPTTLMLLSFTRELASIPAGQFLISILERINLSEIWIGADFSFGHNREGNVPFLIQAGGSDGYAVHVVARQALLGRAISSTAVRELLASGDVASAATLLGHYFRLSGTVARGAGRGAGMGYPTANLSLPERQTVPAIGIYAAYLVLDGRRLPAAVSVGTNPTFGGTDVVVEAYVLDYSEDLRDRRVGLDFVARIRDEERFDSVDALIAQMNQDVEDVRKILETDQEPGELLLR